jgi:hypothetical protein
MCMCGKPTINGQFGYVWNGDRPAGTYPVNPPNLAEGDVIIYDEPGRCGGLDSHSHHLRVVRARVGYYLLVRHGGGDERIRLTGAPMWVDAIEPLDSSVRYWMLLAMHYAQSDAERGATQTVNQTWRKAAADKRIKTRKIKTGIKVWIEPESQNSITEMIAAD